MEKLPGGLYPVMITPFKTNGDIDWSALDQLIDFYLEAGSNGLFANCLSSEMYHLSADERLTLTKYVVDRVNGKIPVVSTGTFGGDLHQQAEFIHTMYDTGVHCVVIITSQLINEDEDNEILGNRLETLVSITDDIPLGVYECPAPFKRLLTPEILKSLAETNRFIYHKDTSCDMEDIIPKLKAVEGSNFGFFNANTPTALDSLKAGVAGISPISGNFYPELYSFLCNNFDKVDEGKMRYFQQKLSLMDAVTRICYPYSAKWFLQKRGLKMRTEMRTPFTKLHSEEIRIMESLESEFDELGNVFGIERVSV
ncbi:MAG: dihydrodipicolinate synthase family protein [Flammeovirgaceae bacterium]|nr:dihydrodipicolinate synthase family protein [Flammeovirgaceae bacterium]